MPLFYTPKPRQFHYEPRFYDPEKEKWEALKKKYANRNQNETESVAAIEPEENSDGDELAYFESKVRRLEREGKKRGLGWRDLFRKREMPTFNYKPRFQNNAPAKGTGNAQENEEGVNHKGAPSQTEGEEIVKKYSGDGQKYRVRIRRRYNMEDPEYMKPVSAGKIMMYVLLAFLLLYWILF